MSKHCENSDEEDSRQHKFGTARACHNYALSDNKLVSDSSGQGAGSRQQTQQAAPDACEILFSGAIVMGLSAHA